MVKRVLFFENEARLSIRNKQLLIQYPNKFIEDRNIPIEDIGIIVIESLFITLNNFLVNELSKNGVVVFFCDEKHLPTSWLLPMDGHTQQTERIRIQMNASLPLKKNLWQQTVSCKILNQANLLKSIGENADNLIRWSREVQTGDAKNHEARAARDYWSKIFPLQGFIRDPEGSSPNFILNYGYSILRGITARAIVGSGILPMFGIFHKNKYNPFGLVDDIMEPYRPYVDEIVLEIIKNGEDFYNLNKDIKIQLMGIMRKDVVIDGKKSPLMVAMSRTTSSLVDCYYGKGRKILYPIYEI